MNGAQENLGKAIARLRKRAKLSQSQLGEYAEIDQPAISKIENGQQDIPTDRLAAIAHGLGVKVSQIWQEAEEFSSGLNGSHAGQAQRKRVTSPTALRSRNVDPDEIWLAFLTLCEWVRETRPAEAAVLHGDLVMLTEGRAVPPSGSLLAEMASALEGGQAEGAPAGAKSREQRSKRQ